MGAPGKTDPWAEFEDVADATGTDPWASFEDVPEDSSIAGGMARAAFQGATADFGDNVVGLVGGDAEGMRAKDDAFAEKHPWLHGIGKGAGIVGSTIGLMLTPGAQPVAGARIAGLGARGLELLRGAFGAKNAMAAVPGAAIPRAGAVMSMLPNRAKQLVAGSHAAQGGLSALKYGALSNAGQAVDDGGALDAAQAYVDPGSAALNYGVGRVGTAAGNRVIDFLGSRVNRLRHAMADGNRINTSDVPFGHLHAARKIAADGTTPRELQEQMFPPVASGPVANRSSDITMRAAAIYGDAVQSGMSDAAARRRVSAILTQETGRRIGRQAVDNLVDSYLNANRVPLMMHEAVRQTRNGGEAINAFGAYDLAIQSGGDAAQAAQTFARDRHLSQSERLSQFLQGYLGEGAARPNFEEVANRTGAANALYDPVHQLFDQTPGTRQAMRDAINRVRLWYALQYGNEQDDIARLVSAQLERFEQPTLQIGQPATPASVVDTGQQGTDSLRSFIRQRGALWDREQELGGRSTQGRALSELRRRLTDEVRGVATDANVPPEVRNVYQQWIDINDTRAGAGALETAFNGGLEVDLVARTPNAVRGRVDALRAFRGMSQEQQEFFRRGLMTRVQAMLSSQGDTHDAAKIFRNQNTRELFEEVIGAAETAELATMVERIGVANKTYGANKDTRSGQRLIQEKELSRITNLLTSLRQLTTPRGAIDAAADYAQGQMNARSINEIMEVLGAHTNDPAGLARAVASLSRADQLRLQMLADQAARDPENISPMIRSLGPFTAIGGTQSITD